MSTLALLSQTATTEELWELTLNHLQLQMTRATFDTWLKDTRLISANNGLWQIGVKNDAAKDWLENRLYNTISRTATNIAGHPVEMEFGVDLTEPIDIPPEDEHPCLPATEIEPEQLSSGQVIAQANYYKGFFERGGAGFAQIVHHTTFFWMTLLGAAFFLWKLLDSDDPRSLKAIKPNYWSLPRKYSYTELSNRLNRQHGRYIDGDALECEQSRLARKAGQPLRDKAGCCGSPNYDLLRSKPHPKGQGRICQHWHLGLLDILRQEGLAAVELKSGQRKPTIQIWRMPPVLTPHQYTRLNSQLQADYDTWLKQYGPLFNIVDRQSWQAITEPSLVSLMPDYDQLEVIDNFDQRRKRQEFLTHAYANPNFVPCMARNEGD